MNKKLQNKKLQLKQFTADHSELYEQILRNAGWSIIRMPDVPTVYLSHKYTGHIVVIEFDEDGSTTGLDIFCEFIEKEKPR